MTTARDEQLCALLDGALSATDERALREEIARDPALAVRLEQLARVDAALRAIPARPVPADLRARLQAKLEAEMHARPELAAIRGGAPKRPRISLRAWGAGFAAAAAAALVVVVGLPSANREAQRIEAPTANATPSSLPTSALRTEQESLPQFAAESSPNVAPTESAATATEPLTREPVSEAPAQQIASATEAPSAFESSEVDAPEAQPEPSAFNLEAELAAAEPPEEAVEEIEIAGAPLTLLVEMNDDEHEALAMLALEDAGVVGVLDVLDALDALEAEAS